MAGHNPGRSSVEGKEFDTLREKFEAMESLFKAVVTDGSIMSDRLAMERGLAERKQALSDAEARDRWTREADAVMNATQPFDEWKSAHTRSVDSAYLESDLLEKSLRKAGRAAAAGPSSYRARLEQRVLSREHSQDQDPTPVAGPVTTEVPQAARTSRLPQRRTGADSTGTGTKPAAAGAAPAGIGALPDDVLIQVMSLLSEGDLSRRAALVCKHWRRLTRCGWLYRPLDLSKQTSAAAIERITGRFENLGGLRLRVRDSGANAALYGRIGGAHPSLTVVDFSYCYGVNDDVVATLVAKCKQLRSVWLGGTNITDIALHTIAAGLAQLDDFNIQSCDRVTDTGLRAVLDQHRPTLRLLNVSNLNAVARPAVEAGAALAGGFPRLVELQANRMSPLPAADVRAMVRACPELRRLGLCNYDPLTDDLLAAAAQSAGPRLEDLRVDCAPAAVVTDAALAALARWCPGLVRLCIMNSRGVTDVGLRALVKACPGLVEVNIAGCAAVSKALALDLENKHLLSSASITYFRMRNDPIDAAPPPAARPAARRPASRGDGPGLNRDRWR